MFIPKFQITNSILRYVGQVEAAKEVVDNAPLVPDYEKKFRSEATLKAVYHGTQIEGNELTLNQARQVMEGEQVVARERDIQEVINYRNVMRYIDDVSEKLEVYDLNLLLRLHRLTVENIVDPEKIGKLRTTQVVIREAGTGKVIFRPPNAVEVPYLISDFLNWLNSEQAKDIHPVLRAGITHYVLVTIHPFVDGNGRAIRALATLVLYNEGYDIKRFFAIEEHFDRDLSGYYEAFFKVDSQGGDIASRDLTPWLEYFCQAVSVEFAKVKDKVRKISVDSRLRVKIGEQVALSARQMKLIEYLSEQGRAGMSDLREVLPMVSEDTILRDLKDLMKKNIVEKEGSTKASVYFLRT